MSENQQYFFLTPPMACSNKNTKAGNSLSKADIFCNLLKSSNH